MGQRGLRTLLGRVGLGIGGVALLTGPVLLLAGSTSLWVEHGALALVTGLLFALAGQRLGLRIRRSEVEQLEAHLSTEIGERKRAEAARQQSERRMLAFYENSLDALGMSTAGLHVSVNAAYARMFGYGHPDELVGKPILDLIAPSHRADVLEKVRRRTSRQDVPSTYETRGLRRDGTEFDMDVSVSTYDDEGEVSTLVVLRDITQRKQAERQLEESEARYRSLYNHTPVMLHSIDHEGRLLAVSDQWLATMGYERSEVIGRPSTDFLTEQSREYAVKEVLPAYWKTGQCKDIPYQLVKRSGETVDVLLSATGEPGPDGPSRSLAVLIDVTERNQLEAALRQSQKLEAIGLMAGGVAHDFNNILTAISGHAQLIASGMDGDNPLRAHVDAVTLAAERAAALTQQLLAFGRRQVLKPQVLDLGAVVLEMDKLLRRVIGEHIELVTDLSPGVGAVKVDPGQLQQVILNLAINARDAMPRGGRLVLRAGTREVTEVEARPLSISAGSYAVLSVEDTGTGMDEATRARIFEPFFTTKPLGSGTGLGLSTVYGIVAQSGGAIQVDSQLGRGSRFHVLLPRAEAPPALPATASPTREAPEGAETILLVEDEEALRQLFRPLLEKRGYRVLEAANGAEAWEQNRSHNGPIHLVVTDVVMPQMGGGELVELLRKQRPAIKVLYVSGYNSDAIVRHGVRDEGTAYLQKPFTPEVLVRAVRRVLDGLEGGSR